MQKHRTLIIGNGFDLDLGLATTYRQFASSELWPITNLDFLGSPLAQKLEEERNRNSWFDIENILWQYAREKELSDSELASAIFGSEQRDREVFNRVSDALMKYIQVQELAKPKVDSVAARVYKAIVENGYFDRIISFNYTDLNKIGSNLGCPDVQYSHVHGSVKDGHVILGIADNNAVRRGYQYMYKTSDTFYKSSNIRFSLQNAEEVVFFGHSLGLQDYHYFQQFFLKQSGDSLSEEDSIKITFFTRDANSQEDMNNRLRDMIREKMNNFRDNNQVQFIRTADSNKTDLEDFLKHLKQTGREEQQRKLDSLASMLY